MFSRVRGTPLRKIQRPHVWIQCPKRCRFNSTCPTSSGPEKQPVILVTTISTRGFRVKGARILHAKHSGRVRYKTIRAGAHYCILACAGYAFLSRLPSCHTLEIAGRLCTSINRQVSRLSENMCFVHYSLQHNNLHGGKRK